jgi:hypothetical protein
MPEIQTIHFGEKIKLYQEPMRLRPSIRGPIHFWRFHDFILDDLSCEGDISISSYFDYPFESNIPARLMNKELDPDEVLSYWAGYINETKVNFLSPILSLTIPEDNWRNFCEQSESKRMPLVCNLELTERQFNVYAALEEVQVMRRIGKKYKEVHMLATTWLPLEYDPSKLYQRWKEFKGSEYSAGGKGEVLIIPNDSGTNFGKNPFIKDMEFSFYPFGGIGAVKRIH